MSLLEASRQSATVARAIRVLRRLSRPFRLGPARRAVEPNSPTHGVLIHALGTDPDLVDHVRSFPKTATPERANQLASHEKSEQWQREFRATLAPLLALLSQLQPTHGFRLLDAGCGAGPLGDLLSELGFAGHYFAFDVVAPFAAFTHERGRGRFAVVQADACAMPFASSSFDLVVSRVSLLSTYDWVAALREHLRVARGHLYLSLVPLHRGGVDTVYYFQHSKNHTSLLCSPEIEAFLACFPSSAEVRVVPLGTGFEVANYGWLEWHDVHVRLP